VTYQGKYWEFAFRRYTFRQQKSICLKVTPFCAQDIYNLLQVQMVMYCVLSESCHPFQFFQFF